MSTGDSSFRTNYTFCDKVNKIIQLVHKMENLKLPVDKKGRITPKLTNSQKFYSEFNSVSSGSSNSVASDGSSNGPHIFTFEKNSSRHRNGVLPRKTNTANIAVDVTDCPQNIHKDSGNKSVRYNSPKSPVAPGISKTPGNQDLKDKALDILFQKKIKELNSK